MQLQFAEAHHEIPPDEKWMWPWPKTALQKFGGCPATAEASDFKFDT